MTSREQLISNILKEDEKRWSTINAEYDPLVAQDSPCVQKRVKLSIPDFALPVQYVPEEMMKNRFVKELVKCKTIENFLKKHPNDPKIRTAHDVELMLRRIRHKYDFLFWAYCCIWIKPKRTKQAKGTGKRRTRVRFKLNYPQIVVFLECEKMRLDKVPIDIILLKARQWGGSTFCIFYQTWLLFKWDNAHSFTVAAHENTASETILRMLITTMDEYPAWDLGLPEDEKIHLAPSGKTAHSYSIKDSKNVDVFPDGQIYIGSAQQPESLRGKNIGGAHYSETGIWPDTPGKRSEDLIADIQGGLLEENLYSMQVMESTAKSEDDYFAKVWRECIGPDGGGYKPIFIPWFYIPHDSRPISDRKAFVEWLVDHKDDEQRDGKWKDSGKHYWWLWTLGASLQGINWYRYKRLKQTSYNQAANEMPSTWQEAFTSAGSHVFDRDEVTAMALKCKEPVKVGTLISNERRDKGVLEDIRFIEQKSGNLKIWEMPDDSPIINRYVVAVDIGGPNPTSDFSSVRVLDRIMLMPDFNGTPSVVAEMHYHVSHDQLIYDAMRLAKWYNDALLVIESNTLEMGDRERDTGGDGSQYILDIAAELYPNLYAREGTGEDIREGMPKKWGFQTNHKTKAEIIDWAQTCIHFGHWYEPCANTVDEFYRYIDDHGKFTAPVGLHDDELMATMILLWIGLRKMPMPRWKEDDRQVATFTPRELNMGTF